MFIITRDKVDIDLMFKNIEALMKRGVKIDIDKAQEIYDKTLKQSSILKKDFESKYSVTNANSPKELSEMLKRLSDKATMSDLNAPNDIIDICYDIKKKKFTTEARAMTQLADLGYEFAQDLLDYRESDTYRKYLGNLIEHQVNGVVYPETSRAITNRVQYKNPPILNIPKDVLWSVVKPYNDTDVLISIDIKNQEPTIMAAYTNDKILLDAVKAKEGLYEHLIKELCQPKIIMKLDKRLEDRVYTTRELEEKYFITPDDYSVIDDTSKIGRLDGNRVIATARLCRGCGKTKYNSVDEIDNLPTKALVVIEGKGLTEVEIEWNELVPIKDGYLAKANIKNLEIEIPADVRKEFKTTWNAVGYGQARINCKGKLIEKGLVYDYLHGIEGYKVLEAEINKKARAGNYNQETFLGTKLTIPETEGKYIKATLLNMPFQGTGADILSALVNNFQEIIQDQESMLYYTRHDELVIEVPRERLQNPEYLKELNEKFNHAVRLNDFCNWAEFKVEVKQLTE